MTIYKFIITICNIVEYLNNFSDVLAPDLNAICNILEVMYKEGNSYDNFNSDCNVLMNIIIGLSRTMIRDYELSRGFKHEPELSADREFCEAEISIAEDPNEDIDNRKMAWIVSVMLINVYRTMKYCEHKKALFDTLKNCSKLRNAGVASSNEVRRHLNLIGEMAQHSPRTRKSAMKKR